jgi:hypothetical protein
VEDKKL